MRMPGSWDVRLTRVGKLVSGPSCQLGIDQYQLRANGLGHEVIMGIRHWLYAEPRSQGTYFSWRPAMDMVNASFL